MRKYCHVRSFSLWRDFRSEILSLLKWRCNESSAGQPQYVRNSQQSSEVLQNRPLVHAYILCHLLTTLKWDDLGLFQLSNESNISCKDSQGILPVCFSLLYEIILLKLCSCGIGTLAWGSCMIWHRSVGNLALNSFVCVAVPFLLLLVTGCYALTHIHPACKLCHLDLFQVFQHCSSL